MVFVVVYDCCFVSYAPSSVVLLVFLYLHHAADPRIYPLSLHDALPISPSKRLTVNSRRVFARGSHAPPPSAQRAHDTAKDRKSTRLNSSHRCISYAVFCLKKKKDLFHPTAPSNRSCTYATV